ncbi:MAG: M28 family peptidase [bacterium]|nr:M28 family peptidase [bacterium]
MRRQPRPTRAQPIGPAIDLVTGLVTGLAAGLVAGLLAIIPLAQPVSAGIALEPTAAKLRDRALDSPIAWELLESLTVEVGQRFAGTPGDRAAVAWAEAKMREIGLQNVRVEPVPVPRWVRGQAHGRILAPYPQDLMLIALGGSVGTPKAGIEAEIVEVAGLEALEELSDEAVAGKIVFFNKRMERRRDGSSYGETVGVRGRGPSAAARKGAVATLIRSVGTGTHRFPHTGALRYADDAPRIPAAALAISDADILEAQIGRGHTVRFHLSLGSHYLEDSESANVIGEVVGREWPDEIVLVGGHLDSWDVGTGAIDDGAGCAVSLGAAKLISELSEAPRRTVRVVLFANEEFGLSGARAYAQAHEAELAKHQLAIESDFGAGRVWRFAAALHPRSMSAAEKLAKLLEPLGIAFDGNRAHGGVDLLFLHPARVPVADLTQDGTHYFDYHHTEDDTLNKVDPEALAQNLAAYTTLVYYAAETETSFPPAPKRPERPRR